MNHKISSIILIFCLLLIMILIYQMLSGHGEVWMFWTVIICSYLVLILNYSIHSIKGKLHGKIRKRV